jgi:hypothetical protein
VVAYAFFKYMGKKWLDQHFAVKLKELEHTHEKKLEDLKHTHNLEIEGLKHEINSLFSRISKVHEKEFEVLPTAWFMLNELHGAVMLALDLTVKAYPDFDRLPQPEFDQFVRDCSLSEQQKEVLRGKVPSERFPYFSEARAGIYLDDAKEKLRQFKNYLIGYSIFMTDELRTKFSEAYSVLASATSKYEVGRRAKSWKMKAEAETKMLQGDLDEMVRGVERAVQARLHHDKA